MNELAKTGKLRTILIFISILMISIYSIYFYNSVRPEIETDKLTQQIIRFCLTLGLLYLIYIGKNWAKNLGIVLFVFGIIGALYAIFYLNIPLIIKTPFIVMAIIYSFAIYHFQFSKSFKEFIRFQNSVNYKQ
jgi:hypothetical protein